MKNIDHRMLGRVLMEYGEEHTPYLCRKAFILGSIEPDKNPLTYLHWQKRGKMLYGHNYENVMPSIQKLYDKLKQGGYSEVKHFYLMGKLAHYTADIFTFPHNKGFTGSIREHGMYEMELHRCMKEAFRDFAGHGKIDIKDMDTLEKLHKEYALQAGTCERDCRYIMQAVQLAEAVRTPESGGNFKRREILNYEKAFRIICRVRDGEKRIQDNIRKRIHAVQLFKFFDSSAAVCRRRIFQHAVHSGGAGQHNNRNGAGI